MSAPRLSTDAAAVALRGGAVLLLATDTVCGLHARADRAGPLAAISALKGRAPDQPLLVLAASAAQAAALCGPLSVTQLAVCEQAWPGPFTFLVPARADLEPAVVDARRRTVAVRVPGRADLRRLIELVGAPLASTSANRTGEPPLTDLAAAVAAFGDGVAGWWPGEAEPGGAGPGEAGPGEAGPGAPPVPSALVDLTGPSPRILRPGPQPLPLPEGGPAVS